MNQAFSESNRLKARWDELDSRADRCGGLDLQKTMQELAELCEQIPKVRAFEEAQELKRKHGCIKARVNSKKVL